jgi:hypothetical protein
MILKNAEGIESKAKHVLKHSEVKITWHRSATMEKTEWLLALWIWYLHDKTCQHLSHHAEKGPQLVSEFGGGVGRG